MSYDPMDQRGKAAAKAEVTKARKLSALQLAGDVKWLMGDPRGRRLMRGWLAFCGADSSPFEADAHRTAFKCGVQNVGVMLKAQLTEHAMDGFFQMLREHLAENVPEGSAHIEG